MHFFAANVQHKLPWYAALGHHTELALSCAQALYAVLPLGRSGLVRAAEDLRAVVYAAPRVPERDARAKIAALAGYVQAAAEVQHELLIPSTAAEAANAARACEDAALAILHALDGDYGHLP